MTREEISSSYISSSGPCPRRSIRSPARRACHGFPRASLRPPIRNIRGDGSARNRPMSCAPPDSPPAPRRVPQRHFGFGLFGPGRRTARIGHLVADQAGGLRDQRGQFGIRRQVAEAGQSAETSHRPRALRRSRHFGMAPETEDGVGLERRHIGERAAAQNEGGHAPFDRFLDIGKLAMHQVAQMGQDRLRKGLRLRDIGIYARVAAFHPGHRAATR